MREDTGAVEPGANLSPNTPELAPLRGKDPLQGWVSKFARRDPARAERYRYALALFLGYEEPGPRPEWAAPWGARKSAETLRAYRYAIAEFFEFLARWHHRVVAPHEVTRKDAADYAEWLARRGTGDARFDFSIEAEKLRDGDRDDELAVYEAVRGGAARFSEIAKALPRSIREAHAPGFDQLATRLVDEKWLEARLLWLIQGNVLERDPKMVQLRAADPRAGLDPLDPIDPDTYTYRVVAPEPAARSTIALRLSALSSFWRVMQRGENTGPKALLDYDVFEEALARASRGLAAEKQFRSEERRPTPELLRTILARADGPRLVDKRNVALLWFLFLGGVRVTEALRLRRADPESESDRKRYPGWLDLRTDPPSVVVLRKGGRLQRLALPSVVHTALGAFWAALDARATEEDPDEPAYRFRLLATAPDAPLFPPLTLWGKNRPAPESEHGRWGYRRSMRRPAVSMLLCRLSRAAGLAEPDRRRIHPHGFRHASAEAMADEDVPLQEIQRKLGHASLTTTEKYLPKFRPGIQPSYQAEQLEWLARGAGRLGPPEVVDGVVDSEIETPTPEPAPEPVTAEIVEEPEIEPLPAAARGPLHELPEPPEPPPARPYPALPEGLVEVGRGEMSAPRPREPYEHLAAGKKPADLAWSPESAFVRGEYPRLPAGFGIGRQSLLLWWNASAPSPWPVLAPSQAYPEIGLEGGLLDRLERLYDRWQQSQPTATLSLSMWLYFLGNLTVGLEERIAGAYSWVTFDALGRVGEDLRAHDDEWLARWFEKNAHTFTAAKRRFRKVALPEPGEGAEEYWARVREDIGLAAAIPTVPELPEWFFEADPVHAIYERDPKEWSAFVAWLRALTGDSERREDERLEQTDFFERGIDADYDRAEGLLEAYFSMVDELVAPEATEADRTRLRASLAELRKALRADYGIRAPTRSPPSGEKRGDRIRDLLGRAFPERAPRPTTNVLGDARLFGPQSLRIDEKARTVVHDAAFRRSFAETHGGRDSECVMRRVARGLWERVRPWRYPPAREKAKRKLTAAEERRELFVTQLALLAYVVPCREDVEEQLARQGFRAPSPEQIARQFDARIRAAAEGREGELDQVAREIVETYRELVGEPEEMLAEVEKARQRERERRHEPVGFEKAAGEREAERERRRRSRKKLTENAARVLPHPIRLVAATFWPV